MSQLHPEPVDVRNGASGPGLDEWLGWATIGGVEVAAFAISAELDFSYE